MQATGRLPVCGDLTCCIFQLYAELLLAGLLLGCGTCVEPCGPGDGCPGVVVRGEESEPDIMPC